MGQLCSSTSFAAVGLTVHNGLKCSGAASLCSQPVHHHDVASCCVCRYGRMTSRATSCLSCNYPGCAASLPWPANLVRRCSSSCVLCLQIWTYDQQNNKLRPENVKLGNLQRQFRSLEVDEQDRFAYAGSTSGDVLQVRMHLCWYWHTSK